MYIRTGRSLHRPSTEVGVEGLSCTLAPAQCRNFEREHFKKRVCSQYSRLPITRTFKRNRKKFELSGGRRKYPGVRKRTVLTAQ